MKRLRKRTGLTQAQLAQQLGLTKPVVSAYENSIRLPSYDKLMQIASIFHVSTDYLLGMKHGQSVDLSGLTADEQDRVLHMVHLLRNKEPS
ncbi:MAG: XRE family transcriptional regulator [Clostridiales bacterium]|nr:MAG: XRE family transcriptional regulator [Clostridiales bacterium]